MYQENRIWIGKSEDEKIYIYPKMANRHGMIAGATGTGTPQSLKDSASTFKVTVFPVPGAPAIIP